MIWEIDDGEKVIEGLDAHGRPDPTYAAALGLVPARFGARVLSTFLEIVVAILILLPASLVAIPRIIGSVAEGFDTAAFLDRGDLVWIIVTFAVSYVLMTGYTIVQLVLHGRKGVTLGKAIVGIRSVNVRTLERPRFWRGAVVRYLLAWASFLIPLIGPLLVIALSPFFDVERRRRGWLDLAAGTWFVDIKAGLNPYDAKRMRIARKRVKTPEHGDRIRLPSLATPVDRDAPAEYVPSARFSGGVIGAHRSAEPPAANAPVSDPESLASSQAPAPSPVAQPSAPHEGLVSAVPPSLSGARAGAGSEPFPVAPAAPMAPAPSAQPEPAAASLTEATPASSDEMPPPASPTGHAPSAAPGVRAALVLDSGQRVEVRGVTLIGRSPAAAAGEGAVQLVQIDDDTRSVSKTHLAFLPARRGVHVVDRASTNGSVLVRDGVEMLLAAGQPAELQTDDIVRFGDRSLRVESA
ncbi:MAG: RDD family protein [Actinomycetota bacterium]